jgi:hypothetical protein
MKILTNVEFNKSKFFFLKILTKKYTPIKFPTISTTAAPAIKEYGSNTINNKGYLKLIIF